MVVRYGMSKLGPGYWGPQIDVGEMGKVNWYEKPQLSDALQARVDKEIQSILDEAYQKAEKVLKDKRYKLEPQAKFRTILPTLSLPHHIPSNNHEPMQFSLSLII